MEKYTVSGRVFDTKEEALAAKRELNAIQTICQRLDVTNPKYAKAVYNRVIAKNMFHTVIGEEFIHSLKVTIEGDSADVQPVVSDEVLPSATEKKELAEEMNTTSDTREPAFEPDTQEDLKDSVEITAPQMTEIQCESEEESKVESVEASVEHEDVVEKEVETEEPTVTEKKAEEPSVDEFVSVEISFEESAVEESSEEAESSTEDYIEDENSAEEEIIIKESVFEKFTAFSDDESHEKAEQQKPSDDSWSFEQKSDDENMQEQDFVVSFDESVYSDSKTEEDTFTVYDDFGQESEPVAEEEDHSSVKLKFEEESEDDQPEWKKNAFHVLYDEEDMGDEALAGEKKKESATSKNYQEFEDDYDVPTYEEEEQEEIPENPHYRGAFFNSLVLNIVLLAGFIIFLTYVINTENLNVLNYERVLKNKYEEKESMLIEEYESKLQDLGVSTTE